MSNVLDNAQLLATLLGILKNQNAKLSEEMKLSVQKQIDELVLTSPDKGDKGDTGDSGPQGIPGIQGDPGEKGPVGSKGVKGVKGDLGDPGNTGVRGEQGVQGDPGIRGLQGSQGIQGEVGPQGIQGETGAKGDKGLDGVDGATGIDGKDGIDGATGVDGKDGTDGVDGKNGVAGKDGVDGVDGKDGKDGAPGENGAQGEKGDPGSDANVAPLEKKFQELSKTVDTKLSKIAYSAVTGTSAGSGEVNLRNLDDVDYNSVSAPTNGHVLVYNSTLGKWQANTASGGGGAATNLNNLVSTSINASLIPGVNSTIDLGSSTKRWKDIYLSGNSIIIGNSIIGAVGSVINLPVGSTIAGSPIGSSNGVSAATFNSALANTNLAISNVKTGLTSTNTALRTLISDRLQVANAAAVYQTKAIERAALANTNLAISNVKTGLTSTNTALRALISDRLQVANASAVYQTKATERAALANTNSFIKSQLANTNLAIYNVNTGLTSTNTALRLLISDRLQVANAASIYQTKAVERAALANTNTFIATKLNTSTFNSALANTNSAISNVKTGLTSTNTALRTLISDRLQVANASAVYQTKATERAALANTNSAISNVKTGLTSTNTALRTLISDRLQVANAAAIYQTKATERAALANTNASIATQTSRVTLVNTNLTGTNTAIRTLVSDRLQVANASAVYQTKATEREALANTNSAISNVKTGLTSTNTALRILISDRLQVANASAVYQTKATERAALANTNSFIKSQLANTNLAISNVKTGLTSTNTALRILISDRLQVANAAAVYQTKVTERAALANTNLAISNVKTGLTSTNTALRTLVSDRLQVANAVSLYTTKSNPTTSGLLAHTGRATISTNLAVSGNTTISGTLGVTGVSTFAAGTALLPALTTSGDTNTGVWFPAADTVAASTGGSERMRIDSSGNVGIGTTSPDFQLEVVGGTNDGIHIKDAESATVFGGLFTQSAALALITRSNHALTLGTNDTTRVTIDNSGNVGIGTASPSNKFTVLADGSVNTTGDAIDTGASIVGSNRNFGTSGNPALFNVNSNSTLGADVGGTIGFAGRYTGTQQAMFAIIKGAKENATDGNYSTYLAFGTRASGSNITEKMRIDSSGNVGIGTTSINARLQFDNVEAATAGSSNAISLYYGSASAAFGFGINVGKLTYNSGDGAHVFYTGGNSSPVERMRITSSGVGLGTSSINARLQFDNVEAATAGSSNAISLYYGSASAAFGFGINVGKLTYNSGDGAHVFYTGGNTSPTERMRIDSGGNVGIGTASPGAKLDINAGGTNKIFIGANISNANYNAISLNANNADSARIGMTGGGSGDNALYLDANANINFRPSGSATIAVAMLSGGNVGIGTTSPSGKLTISDNTATYYPQILLTNSAGGGRSWGINVGIAAISNSRFQIYDHTASLNRFTIDDAGQVGIGTTGPAYQLQISTDSAGKPGVGGLWTVVSDERIKSNIVPANLDRCYEIVKSVPLKYFGFAPGVYTDDQINDKHNLGWIAQDVQKVFKNAVSVKPFTLKTDIPDGVEEYEEQDFTTETVEKTETSIQVINGKPVQVSKVVASENKVMLFDTVDVLDEAGVAVMDGDKPLTYQMPRMITKTRPKVRHDVIEDCLDLNSGQMIAALYGCVQALMAKVEALEAASEPAGTP